VLVEDRSGTRREEHLFTTDLSLTPAEVIGHYTARWNVETAFQECRSCLGLEARRGWSRSTVLRAGPCLLGLYSVAALRYDRLPEHQRAGAVEWPGTVGGTFSDALTAVRRWLWAEAVLPHAGAGTAVEELPEPVRELLFSALATAA
jgi:hypothetical protein